jgi:hypothetical protein
MAGEEVLQLACVPSTVGELKKQIADSGYMAVATQQLLRDNCFSVCGDDEVLEAVDQSFILVEDETPRWYWDHEGNPSKDQLDIQDNVLKCPKMRTDYTNVITREPIQSGMHYFQFHLHHYGDEQWCGLVPDKLFVGSAHALAIPSKEGWMYYTGRGSGALEGLGRRLKEAEHITRSGNVIGMLVDCDAGSVAFDLNGRVQGACELPKNQQLWVLTHVDTSQDHVELRKPSLIDAPPDNLEALKGALLDVSRGVEITRNY